MERIKRKAAHCWKMFQKQRQLWLLCIPIIIWVVVFAYVPMYGIQIAFKDFVDGFRPTVDGRVGAPAQADAAAERQL